MAEEKAPDRSGATADGPSEVWITMVPPDGGGAPLPERLAARVFGSARPIFALMLALAALGAALWGALEGERPARGGAPAAETHAALAGIAAAYGYPPRCLSVTLSASNPAYAHAHIDQRGRCARYRGYINASFHRIDGAWRLVLDEGQLFVPNRFLVP